MAQMYRTWDRLDASRQSEILRDAEAVLSRLDAGEPV